MKIILTAVTLFTLVGTNCFSQTVTGPKEENLNQENKKGETSLAPNPLLNPVYGEQQFIPLPEVRLQHEFVDHSSR